MFAGPKEVYIADPDWDAVAALDAHMSMAGHPKLLPAAEWLKYGEINISAWANLNGFYVIPTIELVEFLKQRIGGRKALEICAGQTNLGGFLGIRMYDNYCQQKLETTGHLLKHRQKPTAPLASVYKKDAMVAIRTQMPQVVIGAFVTEKHSYAKGFGNMYGPNEELIPKLVDTYIHIGNEHTHYQKTLLKVPHETVKEPWIITRAVESSKNVIWIWDK